MRLLRASGELNLHWIQRRYFRPLTHLPQFLPSGDFVAERAWGDSQLSRSFCLVAVKLLNAIQNHQPFDLIE